MLLYFKHPTPVGFARVRRGSMMIELLIGCVIALLTGAALVSLQKSTYQAEDTVQEQGFANASSRRPLDILGDTLRNAQAVPVGAGSQALAAATDSDVTCYTATGTSRIWLDTSAHVLRRIRTDSAGGSGDSDPVMTPVSPGDGGSGSTTAGNGSESLVVNVQSLELTYYVPAGSAYTATVANWTTTADPHAPTTAELPSVGAVNIVATISVNGHTRTLQSFVRMRNSPNTPGS